MNKFHFIFDKNKKSLNFKKKLYKNFKNFPPLKSDCIIVLGGDGFMFLSKILAIKKRLS